jgi:hypothetical protein
VRRFFRKLVNGLRHKSAPARGRRARLTVEALEGRDVPTIVFVPQFGPETPGPGDTSHGMIHPTVHLIFSGHYWNTTQGKQDQKTLIDSTNSILSGPYLSGLTQYGSDGTARFGKHWVDSTTVPLDQPGKAEPKFCTLRTYLRNFIDDHNGAIPGSSNDYRHAPIYVIVSDPASSGVPRGWNAPGSYRNWFRWESLHMIWFGTTTDRVVGAGNDDHIFKDGFTEVLSHELVETMSDPKGSNNQFNAPADLPGSLAHDHQIGDNEPDGQRYGYRLHGDLVQPYWSARDQAFIVPDGNVQNFLLEPIWSQDADGSLVFDFRKGKYNLQVNGDQLGGNLGDNILLDGNPADLSVSVTMNGETAPFDAGKIKMINVNMGGGTNLVQVVNLPQCNPGGDTLTLDSDPSSVNTVVIGDNGSLAGIQGRINLPDASSGQTYVSINGASDPAGLFSISDHAVVVTGQSSGNELVLFYAAGSRDSQGVGHGVTSLTIDEPVGSTIDAFSVGAFTETGVYWEPGLYGFGRLPGLLTGPAASQINVIWPAKQ